MIQKAPDCIYCQRNQQQKDIMIEICDLNVSTLFLFKEQSYEGRCVVAYKDHVKELFELSVEERNAFMDDVCHVAETLSRVFHPAKINMGMYSDKLAHLHVHIAPKYEGGLDFGGTFQMNPNKTFLSDEQYNALIEKIKQAL